MSLKALSASGTLISFSVGTDPEIDGQGRQGSYHGEIKSVFIVTTNYIPIPFMTRGTVYDRKSFGGREGGSEFECLCIH